MQLGGWYATSSAGLTASYTPACPTGWTQVDNNEYNNGGSLALGSYVSPGYSKGLNGIISTYAVSCTNPAPHPILQLGGWYATSSAGQTASYTPACPTGWTQADNNEYNNGGSLALGSYVSPGYSKGLNGIISTYTVTCIQ